jgi:molecular chaperone DnaK
MYLGIDLGTSNSAIVGNNRGELRHFKTPDGTDFLPSAIMLDRRGGMLVGKRAYDQAAFSPESVAQGFKRLMGTSSTIQFSNGRVMTPEEASSEIIKALIGQAQMTAGEFTNEGSVVTIPAAFNQMQSEATMRAAAAAGLERVALLQEPIAAALTSISNSKNKNGQFLVYDLGGGTFDAAIVQTIAASATVIAHAGINMLGGRDFDRAILNSIVRPWLFENFDLANDFHKDGSYQRLIRVAQYRAEMSKIALSTQETDRIFADESQIGVRDRNGVEIFLDVQITRQQLEGLIGDEIDRSVELCRSLIGQSGYKIEDIDRVVLIGGPSRMPLVRSKIGHELGLRVDLDTDPMTSVAFGAAIFAEGREWTAQGATTKKTRKSKVADGPIQIRYDYPSRVADRQFRMRVQVGNPKQAKGVRIEIRDEAGWTSGKLDLEGLGEIRDIPLRGPGENRFKVAVVDAMGQARPESGSEIVVYRAEASAAGMPMTHNLAVKIVSEESGTDRNVLAILVKRGTLLPKSGAEHYRASHDLRSGNGGYLDFEVYEQADEVDDPSLNLPVGGFRLQASNLEPGDIIRRGDPVIVHWSIDENGLLNCKLEFPEIHQTYEIGKMYVSADGHKNFDGDAGQKLASEALIMARDDIDGLERALGSDVSESIQKMRSRVAKQRDTLQLATDSDTRRGISEEGRLIRQEIARIKNKPEFVRSAVRSDIDQFVEGFVLSVSSTIDAKVNTQIQRLAGSAREALGKSNPHAVDDARRSLDEIRGLVFGALAKLPGFWLARFESLAEDRHLAVDKQLHDELARTGEAAIQKNDVDALRDVTFRLSENQVQSANPSGGDALSGLRRD